MKKKLIAAAMMLTVLLTACGSKETDEPKKLYQKTDIESFSQMISFVEADEKYDPDKIRFEYYVQKVAVADDEADADTQVILVSYAKNLESDNEQYTTNAAAWSYIDPLREDGSVHEAKTEWFHEGVPYTAESIIEAAMAEYGESEADMELNRKYVIYSTFDE